MEKQKTIAELKAEKVLRDLGFEVYCEDNKCDAHKRRENGLYDVIDVILDDRNVTVKRIDWEKSDWIGGLREDCAMEYDDDDKIEACVDNKIDEMLKRWNTPEEPIGRITIGDAQIEITKRYEARITDGDVTVFEVITARGDEVERYIEPLLAFIYYYGNSAL